MTLHDKPILIGSNNKNKMSHLKRIFTEYGLDYQLIAPKELGILESPPETGTTFIANSELKAIYYAQGSGKQYLTISDDSGLCVDALDGAPGVYTADWANGGAFAIAIDRLRHELIEAGCNLNDNYPASVVSVLTIAFPEAHKKMLSFEGKTLGYVNFSAINTEAIGFQSIFYPLPFNVPIYQLSQLQYDQTHSRTKALKLLIENVFYNPKK